MNTESEISIVDLIEALAAPDTARGNTLTDMQEHARENPDFALGVVVSLTGAVELYDLTAGEQPLLMIAARLA